MLQLSGIGASEVLGPLGINTLVDLKTVGKNLQEQVSAQPHILLLVSRTNECCLVKTMNSLGAKGNGFNTGGRGPTDAIAYPNIHQLFGNDSAAAAQRIQTNIAGWAQSQADSALSADALHTIYGIQADLIINKNGGN